MKITHCPRNYLWTTAASRTSCSPCPTVIFAQTYRFRSSSIDILHLCRCIEWNCYPADGMLASRNFVSAGCRSTVDRACRWMSLLAAVMLSADWTL